MSSEAAFERARYHWNNHPKALLIAWRTLQRNPGDVTNGMAACLLEYLPARLDSDALEAASIKLRTLPNCQEWTHPPVGQQCDSAARQLQFLRDAYPIIKENPGITWYDLRERFAMTNPETGERDETYKQMYQRWN